MILCGLLFGLSVLTSADVTYFVNDASSALPARFEGVYAVGGGGTSPLSTGELYALTGSGLQSLGSTDMNGGGGLLYDDGTIAISGDTVRVGLAYSFSASRDSSVPNASLRNVDGSGFTVGYYDLKDRFHTLAVTESNSLTVRPGPDQSVEVYVNGAGNERIASLEATNRGSYLTVRAEPADAQPLIEYAGIRYYGAFDFAVLAHDRLTVVNRVDLEHYVMGVCAIEMSESWPVEALKAQAVAARTFVQSMIGTSVYYYTCGFDVTADTYTQAYRGTRNVGDNIRSAVTETANQYLTQNGKLIDALYSAADGGATEDAENVFGYANSALIGIRDPYEEAAENENPYSSWTTTLSPSQLGSLLGIGPIQSVTPTTSRTGNVIKLEFVSTGGQRATLIRDNCRTRLGLRNLRFTVSRDDNGYFVFSGSGFGHNLGMSQWGAYAMAKYYDKDYRFILGFYYTKVGISCGELPPQPEPEPEPEPEETPEPELEDGEPLPEDAALPPEDEAPEAKETA